MNARIGDLAVARFDADPGDPGKYKEYVCIVTGRWSSEYDLIYWTKTKGGRTEMIQGSLSKGRLRRARLRNSFGPVVNLGDIGRGDVSFVDSRDTVAT